MSEKPNLSQSIIGDIAICGEYAFRRHIDEQSKNTSTPAMTRGSAVDDAVTTAIQAVIDGKPLQWTDVGEIAHGSFESHWTEKEILLTDDEKEFGEAVVFEETRKVATRLALIHARDVLPTIPKPLAVQDHFVLEVDGFGFNITGTKDYVQEMEDGTHGIGDTKTTGKKKQEKEVRNSIQLELYRMAHEVQNPEAVVTELRLDFLQPMKRGEMAQAYSYKAPPAATTDSIRLRLERAGHVIEKGAFMPAQPSDWKCSAGYCEFFNDCPFGRARRVQI